FKKTPTVIDIAAKIINAPISKNARFQMIPPTASRIKSTPYVNGKNGFTAWKNSGNKTTGYVPPELAICNTSKMIATAFPTSPNSAMAVYTIDINTRLINNPNMTNQNGLLTSTPRINISPNVTMTVCNNPIVINVSIRPVYTTFGLNVSSSGTFGDNKEINNNPPTHKDNTV